MCGIIGYIGNGDAIDNVVAGLEKLEYRGYDSAGLAYMQNGALHTLKSVGAVENLELLCRFADKESSIAIGHTRWATHGIVSEENTHPHLSNDGKFAVVHNGTIDNYQELKTMLEDEGFKFKSQTDTEIIPNIIQKFFSGDVVSAVNKAKKLLKGSYAFVVLSPHIPEALVACKHGNPPIIIGKANDMLYITSDIPTIQAKTNRYYIVKHDETVCVSFNTAKSLKFETDTSNAAVTNKGNYSTWMEKEINDIPEVLRKLVKTSDLQPAADLILNANFVHITACGTSYHAGLTLGYLLERTCGIRNKVYIASEFTHTAVLKPNEAAIVLTQSGETADTLSAMKVMTQNKIPIIAICNVTASSIARASTVTIPMQCGPEFAVASTKSYCAQVLIAALLTDALKNPRPTLVGHPLCKRGTSEGGLFKELKTQVQQMIATCQTPEFEELVTQAANASKLFFIGKGLDYFSALECALKVKEVTYMHCEGYAAGELKHGTLSLVDKDTVAIVLDTQNLSVSNAIEEIRARGGKVFKFDVPKGPLSFVYSVIGAQVLALRVSQIKGINPDKPRNLAKSVTVE